MSDPEETIKTNNDKRRVSSESKEAAAVDKGKCKALTDSPLAGTTSDQSPEGRKAAVVELPRPSKESRP